MMVGGRLRPGTSICFNIDDAMMSGQRSLKLCQQSIIRGGRGEGGLMGVG
jgi:hypothetical protein